MWGHARSCLSLSLSLCLCLCVCRSVSTSLDPSLSPYPLRSDCLSIPFDRPCFPAAVGVADRFLQSPADLHIDFEVGCGYSVPSSAYLAVRDLHNGGRQPHLAASGPGYRLDSLHLIMNGPESGTHILNITLVDAQSQAEIDWMALCLDVTPYSFRTSGPAPDGLTTKPTHWPPSRQRVVVKGAPPRSSTDEGLTTPTTSTQPDVPPSTPLNVLWLGDTNNFDGMKQFILASIRNVPRELVVPSYMDLACSEPGRLMEVLLIEADVPVFRNCINCPRHLCPDLASFYSFASTLHTYDRLEDLPPDWLEFLGPLARHFAGFDVVVTVNDKPADYYVLHLARLGNPAITTVADLTSRYRLHDPPEGPPPPFDIQLAPSYYVATHPAVYSSRVPTYVTPGSVDPSVFDPSVVEPMPFCDKRTWAGPAGPSPSGTVVGFIARFSPEKGMGLFFAAAAAVLAEEPSTRFFMVGESKNQAYIQSLLRVAEQYGLASHLLVHSFVDPRDVPRVFKCMDVFVAPFVRPATETFALVNVEAMAMEVPFVHFGTGGIQDYAEHLVNSVQAPDRTADALASAVYTLVVQPELRVRLGKTARQQVLQRHTMGAVAANTARVFRRATAARLLDGRVVLDVVTRVLEGPALPRCGPVTAQDNTNTTRTVMFTCKGDSGSVAPPDLSDRLFVELIVDARVTSIPLGLADVFGTVGSELRAAALELFLERYGRQAVLCVEVVGGPSPGDVVCSDDLLSVLTPDPEWDQPPVKLPEPMDHPDAEPSAPPPPLTLRFRAGVAVGRPHSGHQQLAVSVTLRSRRDNTVVVAAMEE